MSRQTRHAFPARRVRRDSGSRNEAIEDALLEELALLNYRPTTGRFLFYRLVNRGVIPKDFPGKKKQPISYVNEVLSDLRWANVIPFGQIVDEGRDAVANRGYSQLIEAGRDAVANARFSPWGDTDPPHIWVEDAGTGQVLSEATYRYAVPIVAMSGQPSGGLCLDVAELVGPGTRVLYLGDWDLGGLRIQKSATERIGALAAAWALAGRVNADKADWDWNQTTWMFKLTEDHAPNPTEFDIDRIAITPAQADDLGHLLTRKTYADGTTMQVIELQALGQDVIEELVVDALAAELEDRGLPAIEEADDETDRQRADLAAALADL